MCRTVVTAVSISQHNDEKLSCQAVSCPVVSAELLAARNTSVGFDCSCEPERAPLRVAVLLSGGVDSSLALRLLQAAGHVVTAFYLQIWFQEDFRNSWGECPWEEDLAFCRQVYERPSHDCSLNPDPDLHQALTLTFTKT